ncbi:VOC family protein [bacterium]|nr:VOC family protein [bacterium]
MGGAGRWVWYEFVTHKPEQAEEFYTQLFGWTINRMPVPGGGGEYRGLRIANDESAGGGIFQPPQLPPDVPSHWCGYLAVDDVDAAAKKVAELGGKTLTEPMDIPDIGRFVVCQDPDGAVFSAYKAAGPQGEHAHGPKPGEFCWNELQAADIEGAKKFYSRICGWTYDAMQMSENMTYNVAKTDAGNPMGEGGLMQKMPETPASFWCPYVIVEDADATAANARELGGQVLAGPMDVPNVGRLGVLMDPLGGVIGFLKPEMPSNA